MALVARVIIVDSSVWAGYFNGDRSPAAARLEEALQNEEDLALLPLILTEVLQGFRTERGFRRARDLVLALPVVFPSMSTHVRAALLFRQLRSKGVTVRGAVDCIIAQACLDADAELLTKDGDFERIAELVPLRVIRG